MLIEQRLEKIKAIIEEERSATMAYLAEKLKVSKDTIRRDLIKLEEQNILRRTHGGAVSLDREATIFNYQQRSKKHNQIKEQIAYKTAEMIKNNCSIIFDSSTTVEAVIRKLHNKTIYAITNSLTHAILLAQFEKAEVAVLPGALHKEQLFLYGSETVKKIEHYHTDYTMLGVFAISADGLFIHTEAEGLVKRQMIEQGNTVIAVADHTKLNTTGLFKVCDLNAIDVLITDQVPQQEFLTSLQNNNVNIITLD